ncbi:MAG TPA: hypothetical protein EYG75_01755 [Campylobacterales bacterium]|nr:hypothetical protein [Campylobacterales bacterium]
MKKVNKNRTLSKPIILILLQIIAVFNIYHLLSTKEYFAPIETLWLSLCLGFIMISSLFTFGALDKLREEEIDREQQLYTSH